MPDRACTVRAVAYWPDDLVLVTEQASGTPRSTLVEQAASTWTGGRQIERTSIIVRRVGEWIQTFVRHTLHVCGRAGGLGERLLRLNRHQLHRHRQWLRLQAAHG